MPECKTVSVQLYGGIALQCPSCPRVMVRDDGGGISCVNPDCDMHQQVFEAPTVELVPRKEPEKEAPGPLKPLEMPTGNEPPWPHPDSYEVKLMQHIWPEQPEQMDELAQANAKIKELRELLRVIEWRRVSVSVVACPVCHRRNDHVPGDPFLGKHLSRCRLKAEIDKLEDD